MLLKCSRDTKDKESLEYVREMNRKRFAETGEYMTKVSLAASLLLPFLSRSSPLLGFCFLSVSCSPTASHRADCRSTCPFFANTSQ